MTKYVFSLFLNTDSDDVGVTSFGKPFQTSNRKGTTPTFSDNFSTSPESGGL